MGVKIKKPEVAAASLPESQPRVQRSWRGIECDGCAKCEPESQPSPSGDYEKEAEQFWETWGWEGWRNDNRDIKFVADWLRAHDAKVGQAEQRLQPCSECAKPNPLPVKQYPFSDDKNWYHFNPAAHMSQDILCTKRKRRPR